MSFAYSSFGSTQSILVYKPLGIKEKKTDFKVKKSFSKNKTNLISKKKSSQLLPNDTCIFIEGKQINIHHVFPQKNTTKQYVKKKQHYLISTLAPWDQQNMDQLIKTNQKEPFKKAKEDPPIFANKSQLIYAHNSVGIILTIKYIVNNPSSSNAKIPQKIIPILESTLPQLRDLLNNSETNTYESIKKEIQKAILVLEKNPSPPSILTTLSNNLKGSIDVEYESPRYTNFNLEKLIQENIASCERKIPIKLSYNLTCSDFLGWKQHLSIIIYNLLNNAVKYTESGSIQIDIFEKESQIHIRIRNTAPPLSNYQIKTIFDEKPLEKNNRRSSWGMGLPHCKTLSTIIKSTLSARNFFIEDTNESGCEFTLSLNLEKDQISYSQNESKIDILVADDEKFFRDQYASILNSLQLSHQIFTNGKKTIDYFQKNKLARLNAMRNESDFTAHLDPKWILLDNRMPEPGDGLQTAKHLFNEGYNAGIMIASADDHIIDENAIQRLLEVYRPSQEARPYLKKITATLSELKHRFEDIKKERAPKNPQHKLFYDNISSTKDSHTVKSILITIYSKLIFFDTLPLQSCALLSELFSRLENALETLNILSEIHTSKKENTVLDIDDLIRELEHPIDHHLNIISEIHRQLTPKQKLIIKEKPIFRQTIKDTVMDYV